MWRNLIIILLILSVYGCLGHNVEEVDVKKNKNFWYNIIDDARWAQNAHNMQSWTIDIISDTKVIGYLDSSRLLPETDPYSRQLILSLGAFSEVARLSALQKGYELNVKWIGPLKWDSSINKDIPLFEWNIGNIIAQKTLLIDTLTSATVKYAVEEIDFSKDEASKLEKKYSNEKVKYTFIFDTDLVEPIKQLAKDSFRVEMITENTANESLINTHYGKKARNETPYGITLLPNFSKNKLGFIEFFAGFPISTKAYGKQAISIFEKGIEPANVLLLMNTVGNTLKDQFLGGMSMQGIWMEIIGIGGTLLPLSQGLQEYHEMSVLRENFHNLLADENETIQMLWSLTKPKDLNFLRSPRLEVEDILSD
ncbi:MAG: hypothetical protein OCD02_09540 [Spirochaetaceae bacterium]